MAAKSPVNKTVQNRVSASPVVAMAGQGWVMLLCQPASLLGVLYLGVQASRAYPVTGSLFVLAFLSFGVFVATDANEWFGASLHHHHEIE